MMRIALAVALAAPALTVACAPLAAPSVTADATTLDERAGIAAETFYTASSLVGAKLVQAGKLSPEQYRALDNRAYSALLATRAAYRAGNASNYATAAAETRMAATAIFQIVGAK